MYSVLVLALLCWSASLLCYIDRTTISVAILPMAAEFRWAGHVQGYVLSAFFVGYLSTQVLGGVLAQRVGGARVLGAAVALWSGFTLATPRAAGCGPLWVLLAARVGMGMGEGLAMPAILNIASVWFPSGQRSALLSFVLSGFPCGMVCVCLTRRA